MKRIAIRLGIGLSVLFLGLQFIPVEFPSGKNAKEIQTEESVKKIFRRSCYDCHSDLVKWPWYSRIFPVSLYLIHHVEEGKDELNFSDWENLKSSEKADLAEKILEEIEDGEMPLWDYKILHPESKLDQEDLETVRDWLQTYTEK
ncbi:heme-binding domain protein [Leptospira inadai serovar Lyme str. 10]|uniref:Heme-binding domain protein n=2 Tax=Leptospira inadai serovar Lyme TaxID=293084 RepID=V6HC03_9LEPT|nr:heme-binding domain-containing protein [Leptospira inadai]EQA37057.1 heme-binding domain protein [Leptospira inadai serovar Lyme str. 10]PNV76552.1 heme-binding protein [Leptospira inadai serovar Lyme]